MSAAAVRAAIAQFLSVPPIQGLGAVYLAEPFFLDGSQFKMAQNNGWGAVGFLWFDSEEETRITLPALTGSKGVKYSAMFVVDYQWLRQDQTGAAQPDAWISPLDLIVEGLKTRLRADPTLGAPATIFEAAQSPNDLKIRWDVPYLDSGKVRCRVAIDFEVTEIVTA